MKLVVISPEHDEPREAAVLAGLFAAGLERYHVRKPHWPVGKLAAWLRTLPEAWRSRLVLHEHHELVALLGLGGQHWRDMGAVPAVPTAVAGFTSRSCHDLPALRVALGHFDSVLISPVFPSISKPGHGQFNALPHDILSELLHHRTPAEQHTAVIGLSGITHSTIVQCREMGFDGVAVLGAVWQAVDPVAAFAELYRRCQGTGGRPGRHPKHHAA